MFNFNEDDYLKAEILTLNSCFKLAKDEKQKKLYMLQLKNLLDELEAEGVNTNKFICNCWEN